MPPWFFGYRFKWKHVRRLAREQGILDEEDVLATEDRVRYFLQSKSKVNIHFESDYKDYIICFHKSAVRGDLSHFKADIMEKIREVGRIFYGKDHEPRWFAAYNDMAARMIRARTKSCHRRWRRRVTLIQSSDYHLSSGVIWKPVE